MELFGSVLVPLFTYLLPGGIIFGWAKPIPYNPYNLRGRYGEMFVALAGPVSNLLIAFVVALGFRFFGVSYLLPAVSLMMLIVLVNITLAIFNMIPLPPLDGFKVLSSLLPHRISFVVDFIKKNTLLFIVILIFTLSYILDPLVFWVFRVFMGTY